MISLTLTLCFKFKIWALSHQTYGHYVNKINHFFSCAFSMSLQDVREDSSFQRVNTEGKERHLGIKFVLIVMVNCR